MAAVAAAVCCDICCEAFTRELRKPIRCPFCQYNACQACCKKYLTSVPQPECMSCHAIWDAAFILSMFQKAWVTGPYARHRETVLYDYEISQLPASQYLVENFRTRQTLLREIAAEKDEKKELKERLAALEASIWNKKYRADRIETSRYRSDGGAGGGGGGSREEVVRRDFVRPCPVEECRGFLSSALKCGTCSVFACGRCLCVIGERRTDPHECSPEDVATADLIKRESKPCPTCGISISKISGCSQMWCTQCNTAFDWRTGLRVTGAIHNPHYFAWMRTRNNNNNDNNAPDLNPGMCPVQPNHLMQRLRRLFAARKTPEGTRYAITSQLQHAMHLLHAEIPRIDRTDPPGHPPEHVDLRLRYLLKELGAEDFKRALILRERKRHKNLTLRACYEAKANAIVDVLRAYAAAAASVNDDDDHHSSDSSVLAELREIFAYFHKCLVDTSRRFNCVVQYGPNFHFVTRS
jgi:hypothetical protein